MYLGKIYYIYFIKLIKELYLAVFEWPQSGPIRTMNFQLTEIENEAQFAELVKTEFLAYEKPFNAFWEVLKGPNIEECT